MTDAQRRAARILEAMYAAAQAIGEESNPDVFNPGANPTLRRVVLSEAYPLALGAGQWTIGTYDRAFKSATAVLAPLIRDAAAAWALKTLDRQAMMGGNLKFVVSQYASHLHAAARTARRDLKAMEGESLTSDEMKAVLGESGNREGGTILTRFERVSYMRAVLAGKNAYLHRLMVHPRGVRLVKEFASSAEGGRDYALEIITETEEAMLGLAADIRDDSALIWRFPPALTAGVATLGLGAGMTGFAHAWARWGEPDTANDALDVAGNALMALELVGGPPGALVAEVLDFMLGLIGTVVAFVRALEQDQAATATAFGSDGEVLSKGGSYTSAALVGAATLVAVVVPVAVSQLGKRGSGVAKKLVVKIEELPPAVDLSDTRAVTRRGVENTSATTVDRLADQSRRTADNGTLMTGKNLEVEPVRVKADVPPDPKVVTGDGATTAKATEGTGTSARGTVNPPAPAPATVKRARAATDTPGMDTRTAGGGIRFIREQVTPDNRRFVEIVGRINAVPLNNTPESIFRTEWASGEAFGLVGYERCHLFPLQWGDEAAAGFMYANGNEFNRGFQKRLENYVALLRQDLPPTKEMLVRVRATSADRGKFGGNLLEQIEYEFSTVGSKKATVIRFKVGPPPNGRVELEGFEELTAR